MIEGLGCHLNLHRQLPLAGRLLQVAGRLLQVLGRLLQVAASCCRWQQLVAGGSRLSGGNMGSPELIQGRRKKCTGGRRIAKYCFSGAIIFYCNNNNTHSIAHRTNQVAKPNLRRQIEGEKGRVAAVHRCGTAVRALEQRKGDSNSNRDVGVIDVTMGRGKFKSKPTGRRQFSTPEDLLAGTSNRPRTFRQKEAEHEEEEIEEASGNESGEESEEETSKKKGTQGIIEIENPNLVKPKSMKARDVDVEKTTELSRREREELEKQRAHERYMRLQEQGKTEQAKKDLERLALIRQQRAEAAKKREEEKAAKEQKKAEARK
ncbi:hypothetical protein RJT34_13764 [Clitoria ternatea]|uniref:Casein kinase substrate phosphoprotein PP28 domain-containing protein n=1 Tax=Clitoria ternatea TaxID=43366 RepID=A0AAN9PMK0_CLITE